MLHAVIPKTYTSIRETQARNSLWSDHWRFHLLTYGDKHHRHVLARQSTWLPPCTPRFAHGHREKRGFLWSWGERGLHYPSAATLPGMFPSISHAQALFLFRPDLGMIDEGERENALRLNNSHSRELITGRVSGWDFKSNNWRDKQRGLICQWDGARWWACNSDGSSKSKILLNYVRFFFRNFVLLVFSNWYLLTYKEKPETIMCHSAMEKKALTCTQYIANSFGEFFSLAWETSHVLQKNGMLNCCSAKCIQKKIRKK